MSSGRFLHLLLRAALAVLAFGAAADAQPSRASWSVAPPPSWVRELELPPPAAPAPGDAAGRVYRLVDHQVRVANTTVEYNRLAWTFLSTESVQNASEIQIAFDPSYQRLVIHHLRLLRDGSDVFSFSRRDVRIIQPETGLDEQIYSGVLTAVVFLRDLRPGDTLDYAYSLDGANPIVGRAFDDVLWLQHSSPVELLRHVLVVPASLQLQITPRNTPVEPSVTTSGAWRSYTWEVRDVGAQIVDEDEPGWFDPDPRVSVSTFRTWAEVARWAAALFDAQARPSPEIRTLADTWRGAPGGVLEAVAAATRFVQDEIRYLGIELGPNSHAPHSPGQVLRQRFGDCKDKSLLLVTLLRELGVDAAPALVDTARGRGLDEEPPSAFAFDHAIVHLALGDRVVWVDPTESGKGGPLVDWDPPPYERALVLRPGADRLTVIDVPEPAEPLIEVVERYTVGATGRPVRLDIATTYRGFEADQMRRTLAATPRQDLGKEYLDYFAKEFSEIKQVDPPAGSDDRARNVLVVTESYEVGDFWKGGERELFGWQVRAHMPRPAASTRTTPLAVPHPARVVHRLVIRAAEWLHVAPRRASVSSDAFAFSADLAVDGREMKLTFDYRSRADAVMPAKIKAHQQAVERVLDELSFVLKSDMTEAGAATRAIAWRPIATLAGVLAVLAVAVLLVGARRRRSRRDGVPHDEPGSR